MGGEENLMDLELCLEALKYAHMAVDLRRVRSLIFTTPEDPDPVVMVSSRQPLP
jgi:hypothetical protein